MTVRMPAALASIHAGPVDDPGDRGDRGFVQAGQLGDVVRGRRRVAR